MGDSIVIIDLFFDINNMQLPSLEGLVYLKGNADLTKPTGKAICVECWATWCPPCRASIPHLTALSKKYSNVMFVGVTNEPASEAKKFVDQMGAKMDYIVASDEAGSVQNKLMEVNGVQGIPHAFLFDKTGKMVYSGHPMVRIEYVISDIQGPDFVKKLDIVN